MGITPSQTLPPLSLLLIAIAIGIVGRSDGVAAAAEAKSGSRDAAFAGEERVLYSSPQYYALPAQQQQFMNGDSPTTTTMPEATSRVVGLLFDLRSKHTDANATIYITGFEFYTSLAGSVFYELSTREGTYYDYDEQGGGSVGTTPSVVGERASFDQISTGSTDGTGECDRIVEYYASGSTLKSEGIGTTDTAGLTQQVCNLTVVPREKFGVVPNPWTLTANSTRSFYITLAFRDLLVSPSSSDNLFNDGVAASNPDLELYEGAAALKYPLPEGESGVGGDNYLEEPAGFIGKIYYRLEGTTGGGTTSASILPTDDDSSQLASLAPSLSSGPTSHPSAQPSAPARPSSQVSVSPTIPLAKASLPATSSRPSDPPSVSPAPSSEPSARPSVSADPSGQPSVAPSLSSGPTSHPSAQPSASARPSSQPSVSPTIPLTKSPSTPPSAAPSGRPSITPSLSSGPTSLSWPSAQPSASARPSVSAQPSSQPSTMPTIPRTTSAPVASSATAKPTKRCRPGRPCTAPQVPDTATPTSAPLISSPFPATVELVVHLENVSPERVMSAREEREYIAVMTEFLRGNKALEKSGVATSRVTVFHQGLFVKEEEKQVKPVKLVKSRGKATKARRALENVDESSFVYNFNRKSTYVPQTRSTLTVMTKVEVFTKLPENVAAFFLWDEIRKNEDALIEAFGTHSAFISYFWYLNNIVAEAADDMTRPPTPSPTRAAASALLEGEVEATGGVGAFAVFTYLGLGTGLLWVVLTLCGLREILRHRRARADVDGLRGMRAVQLRRQSQSSRLVATGAWPKFTLSQSVRSKLGASNLWNK